MCINVARVLSFLVISADFYQSLSGRAGEDGWLYHGSEIHWRGNNEWIEQVKANRSSSGFQND